MTSKQKKYYSALSQGNHIVFSQVSRSVAGRHTRLFISPGALKGR